MKKYIYAPCVFALLVIADRFIKIFIMAHFYEGQSVAIIPNVFHLTRVNNTGAAFGFMKNSRIFLILFSVVFLLILASAWLCGIAKEFKRRRGASPAACPTHLICYAWALVGAGAFGNLWDRLMYGYVLDYVDFRVWPVFNLTDSAISIGVALLLVDIWFGKKKTPRQAP